MCRYVPLCAALAAIFSLWLPFDRITAQPRDPEVVETLCSACHSQQFDSTARGPHSVLDDEAWQEHEDEELSCLGCHGDVSEHLSNGGGRGNIFGFRAESPLEQAEVCNACHRDTHPRFDQSPHARAGLTCTDCHSQHDSDVQATSLLRFPEGGVTSGIDSLGARSAVCLDCHNEQFSEFDFNERHRLREGVLECTSCHDPHEPATRAVLGGFKQQECTQCHADKGGPFVFEHDASRVEGCTACHAPHGSPNRHLLEHQRVGELCLSCHASVPQFHTGFSPAGPPRFGPDTQCTNCHSAIHGSNFDPHFLR